MFNSELAKTLIIAAESVDNIALKMLLLMAAERLSSEEV